MTDTQTADILYTLTDEAPLLATASFLPIVRSFLKGAGVSVETVDISLAARILAAFSDELEASQQRADDLARLGGLVQSASANIIKLPNISASVPQLIEAIEELQAQGFALPAYPEEPENETERAIKKRYDAIKGSAVNPVLREGNADRRVPAAVKAYVKKNPHRMGEWPADSATHVAHMDGGDFFANEVSCVIDSAQGGDAVIEFVADDSSAVTRLGQAVPLEAGDVLDASFMSVQALRDFIRREMDDAKDKGVLFSVHLKATMMKVSDPEIFGHVVEVFFAEVFERYADVFDTIGVDARNGLSDIYDKIEGLEVATQDAIRADIDAALAAGPDVMMVNSDLGITNLHRPNDVIIDASIPPIIRGGGYSYNADGDTQQVKIIVPDSCYAVFHKAMVEYCRAHGAFDPATMGTVQNVGLMAQKAEEYGSHNKTFMAPNAGEMRIVSAGGDVLHSHHVERGDIWRACVTKDAPILNWAELAVSRGRITGHPIIFWLDSARAHDAEILGKVQTCLESLDTDGLEIQFLAPEAAALYTNKRVAAGQDTIAATGNVLRDHVTDMYPILEVGTSAKMLSIVPLMNGGGLFETGAGGSAPKHVQQLLEENHLRWNSLGEFCALVPSLEQLSSLSAANGDADKAQAASILAAALDAATERVLDEDRSPSRKAGEPDNRDSHFYIALYWAQALAAQNDHAGLQAHFAKIAEQLASQEATIIAELLAAQGGSVDLGGYYHPDATKLERVMRPSSAFNQIID